MCGGHVSAGHSVLPSTLMVLTPRAGCKIADDMGEAQSHLKLCLLRKVSLVSTLQPTCCNFSPVLFVSLFSFKKLDD